MKQINVKTLLENMTYYVQEAKNGAVFVYPTDTIYGLGGVVTSSVVDRLDQIKQRLPGKHYSIIAPSITRIQKYMHVSDDFAAERDVLKKQYGPITLLLKPKLSPLDKGVELGKASEGGLKNYSLLSSSDLIGVRLIDHPMQELVTALGEPYITTSANISGQPSISCIDQLSESQYPYIDYIIDDGTLEGSGSTVIVYASGEIIRSTIIQYTY